ncbi:MAG: GntR family transcriptional regulator [Spirochaetes bacterium]|nr:GntR family transcriptional regulator [Spirochaetota bacterium]
MTKQPDHKYEIVKQYFINFIQKNDLKKGDKVFSENEAMERLKVSRHTVRKAIGDLINEGWLISVKGMGTFVNDPGAFINKPSKLIGVITTYITDYIFPEIIAGLEDVFHRKGYNIMLGNTSNEIEKERQCLLNFLGQDLAGVVIDATKSAYPSANIDLLNEFRKRKIPVLFIHSYYREFDSSYVVENDEYGGYTGTLHLIKRGMKKPAGIFKSDDMQGHLRYKGFLKALSENSMSIEDDNIIWFNTYDKKNMLNKTNSGFIDGRIIDILGRCDGILCYNDEIAYYVLEIAKKTGIKIPENCRLVGFDDSKLAIMADVKLTSVSHPKNELGRITAESIIKMINKSETFVKMVIKPELIVREST